MNLTLLNQLLMHRLFIVIIGLFSISIFGYVNESLLYGDSNYFPIHQGDHVYLYNQPPQSILNMWSVWDTKWYVSIAEDGYSNQKPPYEIIDNKGFLPIYPIVLFIFSKIIFFGNVHIAGVFISNVCLFFALFFLIKLIKTETALQEKVSFKEAFLYTLIFPTSYYLSAIYPESLFLLLSILVFYFVSTKKIIIASLLFSIACLTKTFGIFLCIPIIHYLYTERQHIPLKTLLASIGTALIFPLLYCAYMYAHVGDIFAYIHIQQIFFSHVWAEPLSFIVKNIMTLKNFPLWHSAFAVFGLVVMIFSFKKIPITYSLYGFIYILFTPFTGILDGTSRYMASLFVLPIALSAIIKKDEIRNMVFVIFSMIQGFTIFWWIMGAGFTS